MSVNIAGLKACGECEGTGKVDYYDQNANGPYLRSCYRCDGYGHLEYRPASGLIVKVLRWINLKNDYVEPKESAARLDELAITKLPLNKATGFLQRLVAALFAVSIRLGSFGLVVYVGYQLINWLSG